MRRALACARSCPRAAFSLLIGQAARFVALFEVFGLSLLLVGMFVFVAARHSRAPAISTEQTMRSSNGSIAAKIANSPLARSLESSGSVDRSRLRAPAVSAPQFIFRVFQNFLPVVRQILTRAIDIKGQHRHGGLKRPGLSPAASVGRALQRCRDLLRIILFKHMRLKLESAAVARDVLGPLFRAAGHHFFRLLAQRLAAQLGGNWSELKMSGNVPTRAYP